MYMHDPDTQHRPEPPRAPRPVAARVGRPLWPRAGLRWHLARQLVLWRVEDVPWYFLGWGCGGWPMIGRRTLRCPCGGAAVFKAAVLTLGARRQLRIVLAAQCLGCERIFWTMSPKRVRVKHVPQ